jgi:1,4-alpha-glucan branching enzyme
LQTLVRELNRLYRENRALHQVDFHHSGFEWIDFHDIEHSIVSFLRRADDAADFVVFACNFTPVPRLNYRLGVPEEGFYEEILNTDAAMFGGSNLGNGGMVSTEDVAMHGRPCSLALTLPPLAVVAFRPRR